jgi:hypothetical protein
LNVLPALVPVDWCMMEPVDFDVDELVWPLVERLDVVCDEPVEWLVDFEDEPFEGGFPASAVAASDATASKRRIR